MEPGRALPARLPSAALGEGACANASSAISPSGAPSAHGATPASSLCATPVPRSADSLVALSD